MSTNPGNSGATERLLELAERVEAAAGPDRELDAEIAVAVQYDLPGPMGECAATLRVPRRDDECQAGTYWLVQRSGMSLRTAPPFTESLDSALKLVPSDWRVLLETGPGYSAIELVRGYGVKRAHSGGTIERPDEEAPLLVCAAALRARGEAK
jgi:hypothetical protein